MQRVVFIIGALGLTVAGWIFGMGLLPSMAAAQERSIAVPLVVIWVMIGITTVSGIAIAAFLTLKRDLK